MLLRKSFREQINIFEQGNAFIFLEAPVILNKGIKSIDEEQIERFIVKYEQIKKQLDIVKFVPASGAATRMFKDIFLFYQEDIFSSEVKTFFEKVLDFPFADFIKRTLKLMGKSTEDLNDSSVAKKLIDKILKNFNYTILPKGLIPFHLYEKTTRTAFEEHFVEAASYCNGKGLIALHFTVSPKDQSIFKFFLRTFVLDYEKRYNCAYKTTFSIQDAQTDTVVVDLDNRPLLDDKGKLLQRPAGHGALIKNLNELNADIIFIKNIDNVTTDSRKPITVKYKKALAGLLLSIQHNIFTFLKAIDKGELCINSAVDFLQNELNTVFSKGFESFSQQEKIHFIREKLNRPLRVCGMVKNEGEAGGGPFWVKKQGKITLQIVELSQVDLNNPKQKQIVESSTHFNPVDIVCGVKDYKGNKFDLMRYIDPDAYFIAEKTHQGKPIKALELPGLWNGAMSDWNTVFVQVPLETFSPVKTVLDLLKPEHLER